MLNTTSTSLTAVSAKTVNCTCCCDCAFPEHAGAFCDVREMRADNKGRVSRIVESQSSHPAALVGDLDSILVHGKG